MISGVTMRINIDEYLMNALKEDITQEDIKAKFENGVLTLDVPKKEAKPAVETKKYVTIEG